MLVFSSFVKSFRMWWLFLGGSGVEESEKGCRDTETDTHTHTPGGESPGAAPPVSGTEYLL